MPRPLELVNTDHAPARVGANAPQRVRHVVVEGSAPAPGDSAAQERLAALTLDRRALHRRLADVAAQAAWTQWPALGAALLLLALLPAWRITTQPLFQQPVLALPWLLATLVLGLVLIIAALRRHNAPRLRWQVAASLAVTLCLAWPAWGLGQAHALLSTAAATLFGVAAAQALAMVPRAALAPALLPALAGVGSAVAGDWQGLALGLAGSACAALLAQRGHRTWQMQQLQLFELGEQLRAAESAREAAVRTDQDKSRFLAIASHDLRQPVHALGLFAATLQKRLIDSPDEPLARNLMRAVDGLERSFNAMLDVSKLDAGAISPAPQTFPLRDMFRRLHMQYAGQAEFAGLGLRFSPGGKSVTSDPQLLERIVGNLIQNAIKYTSQGGIVVVARSTASRINIEVWDTGCGIAAGDLPRVFEEFFQVGHGERDRSHGLGMGLAIVKRLAALLGHRLEVASTPGRGTLFRVGVALGGLPGMQDELAPADTQPMQAQGPLMVLVVDDEEPIREGLRLLLAEWGMQVITAADAAQAEQAVTALEGRVDLVLSDLHLGPGPDGMEVIARVRRLCGREVPAILITGDTGHDDIQRVASAGDLVLFKPVQPRRLFEAMRSALG